MLAVGSVFLVLLVIGAPIAFAIGLAGFVFFVNSDVMPLTIGVQKIASVSQSFPLLAVPFFVFAGHLMNGQYERDARVYRPELPRWLGQLLASCLDQDPRRRPPSAGAMAARPRARKRSRKTTSGNGSPGPASGTTQAT